jgi:mRNA interferase RelE/StbE
VSSISIRWDRRAIKELHGLPKDLRNRIFQAVDGLRSNPLLGTALSGEWKGLRRLRVGTHRVIYAFDGRELLVSVIKVGHRREIYRSPRSR